MNRRSDIAKWFLFLLAILPGARGSLLGALTENKGSGFWIDCGTQTVVGSTQTRIKGPNDEIWSWDEPFNALYRWGHTGAGNDADSPLSISGAKSGLGPMFSSHRWGGTDMAYRIELPDGRYRVLLEFAETHFTAPGQRVFDVAVEGVVKVSRLDVLAAKGFATAHEVVTEVDVTDGALDVTFPAIHADQAMISGIGAIPLQVTDESFLRFLQRKMFWYFWNETDPATGLISDRSNNWTPGASGHASIAATGFGLSVLTVAAQQGWITPQMARDRIMTTLDTFENRMFRLHGFWYHFVNRNTGQREGSSEVSTIDSALFIAGALQAGEYFRSTYPEIADKAKALYDSMDWAWWRDKVGPTDDPANARFVNMGWRPDFGGFPNAGPEGGYFVQDWWNRYCEGVLLNLLALGSPTHPVEPDAWTHMSRRFVDHGGATFAHEPPLFTHQYQHLYFDLRNTQDGSMNYEENTRLATINNRMASLNDTARYGTSGNRWGLSAGDGLDGGGRETYIVYGAPPGGFHDGTVVLTAALTSMPFTPTESLAAARHMFDAYKHVIWGRHGFSDSFNVNRDYRSTDALGLDNGPIILAIENQLTGMVRDTFMNALARGVIRSDALARAGFVPVDSAPRIFASSQRSAHIPSHAFDGDPATRWESDWYDPQWLAMDFGSPRRINKAFIRWETAHGRDYRVEVSQDGHQWTTVKTVENGDGGEDSVSFPEVEVKYARVHGTRRGGIDTNGDGVEEIWGYSIWECRFELDTVPQPPVPPSELSSVARTAVGLTWTWTDNSTDETAFRLYGATSGSGPFALVAEIPADATTYQERGLAPGQTCHRFLAAVNDLGEAPSPVVEAQTEPASVFPGPRAADGAIRAVFDAAGRLHVTYFDESKKGLRYVSWDGASWSADEMIDARASGYPSADGSAVFLAAQDLAVDASGLPRAVYATDEGFIRYAVRKSTGWANEPVTPGNGTAIVSLTLDPAGLPHVSVALAETGETRYARKTASGWTVETIPGVAANTAQITLDGSGRPHMVHGTHQAPHALKYLLREGGAWSAPQVVDSLDTWRYRVGPALLIDGDGRPQAMDSLNNRDGRVRYSRWTGSRWESEYAHYEERDWLRTGTTEPGFVLDGQGTPHALYLLHFRYDPHWVRTLYATRVGGRWHESSLSEDQRWGANGALALDARGLVHAVSLNAEGNLRLIRLDVGASAPMGGGRNGSAQAPTHLSGFPSAGGITWTWMDNAANETGYRVYGATSASGPFSVKADLPAGATVWSEPAPAAGTTHYRYVSARNAGGESASGLATAVRATLKAPGKPGLSTRTPTSITWKWTDRSTGEQGYRVRNAVNGLVLADGLPANSASWPQAGLGVNSSHQIVVESYAGSVSSASSPSNLLFTLANKPAGTQVVGSVVGPTLAWNPNGNPEWTRFESYKSLNGSLYTLLSSGTAASAPLSSLTPGVMHYLRVRALNGNGLATPFDTRVSTTLPAFLASAAQPSDPGHAQPAFELSMAGPEPVILLAPDGNPLPPPPFPWRLHGPAWRVSGEDDENPPLVQASLPGAARGRMALGVFDVESGRWTVLNDRSQLQAPATLAVLTGAPPAPEGALRAYPNPFRPSRGHEAVAIPDLGEGTRLRVYAVSGRLVRELTVGEQGIALWDGRNQDGRPVAAGVYMLVVEKDGAARSLRIAVLP